jgi:hypothetical protein
MDALPLPAAPDLELYRRLADRLQQAREDGRVRQWASGWLAELAALLGSDPASLLDRDLERASAHIDRLVGAMSAAGPDALAQLHGFASWQRFARHLEELADPSSRTARFEAAADAVVSGDQAALAALLQADPGLVRARSNRRSQATLLHYVAANGVEDFRQKTPANIVDIARVLLAAGAEVDAANGDYGGDGTTLGLVATSIHPQEAGVQLALMDLLASAGASLEGLPGGSWRPMDAAVANGCPEAATWLADHGARVTIIAAAALGRAGDVERELASAPPAEIEQAFVLACGYGQTRVAELMLDRGFQPGPDTGASALRMAAEWKHDDTVDMLRARGVRSRGSGGSSPPGS